MYHLLESILYVRKNEPTARIVFAHAYQHVEDIPSELAPNVKILDEAFPSITLDLVFVQGTFGPAVSDALFYWLDVTDKVDSLFAPQARSWIFHTVACSCPPSAQVTHTRWRTTEVSV